MIQKQHTAVGDRTMAYVDVGEGDPIVFLHGNPTSSYLWRNIIPHVSDIGRCIAPDLIGMGDSDKLPDSGPDSYRFVEHREYLDGLLDAIGVADNVTFVIHDWGSALGFDWSYRHQDAVKGICFMEAIVKPVTWDDWPPPVKDLFKAFRSPEGEALVLDQNVFVEMVLPGAVLRDLTEEEMNEYRRPFATPGEGRRPTLTWPREIPLEGEPEDVVQIVTDYGNWLATSEVPKLFVNAKPGAILREATVDWVRGWPNVTEVEVPGSHFIQEDSADEIGRALRDWLTAL